MEKNYYYPQKLFNNVIRLCLLIMTLLVFTTVTSYGQNRSATLKVHVNCQGLGANELQVIGIGKGYSVMLTTNSNGDVVFPLTWSGSATQTFYFYVNAAYGDFNGPNNTAVAVVDVTNGSDTTNSNNRISFVLNANSEKHYAISGTVYNASVGQSGVVVRLYRLQPTAYTTWAKIDSVTTDANGNYIFPSVTAIGIYKTDANKAGFLYAPNPYNYSNLTGALTNQNFTSVESGITRTVSGYVYKYGTSTPIPNALVTLYRGNSTNIADIYSTALTNPDGSYSFLVFDGSSYTMVPSMDGYSFALPAGPPSVYYASISGNVSQDFYGQLLTYNLSGTILSGGSPLQYTKVMLYQAVGGNKILPALDSMVTGTPGTYSFANVPGRSDYIIEPAGVGTTSAPNTPLPGYNFNPVNRSVYFLIGNQTGLDFSANKNTVRISGYLLDPLKTPQGVENIVVNITGGTTQQYSTSPAGYYEFYAPARTNYTITPVSSLTGYLFVDLNSLTDHRTINGDTLLGNKDNLNFRADIQSYTISGTVYNDASPLNGVTLSLSGTNHYGGSVNQTYLTGTGANGTYTFTVGALGDYTISPSLSGSDFSPASRSFTAIVRNETQNFTTTTNTKHVYGFIRTDVNNTATGINEIPLTFVSGSLSFSTVTQTNGANKGYYSIYLPAGNTYRITPQIIPDNGYRFTYPSDGLSYHDVGPLTLNENGPFTFNADTAHYTISGNVFGTGSEVTRVTIVGGSVNTYQDVATDGGAYTFTNLLGLTNYTITPSSLVYNFDPISRDFSQLNGDKTNQNFNASATIKKYKIKGKIAQPGSTTTGLENVVVTITSGATTTGIVATDPTGYYEFLVNAGGSYTVTPELTGYNFAFDKNSISPASTTSDSIVSNIRADSIVNFISTYQTATISGKVYDLGLPLNGVVFKLEKRDVGTGEPGWVTVTSYGAGSIPTSDGTGQYRFTLLEQRHDYRVTPTPGTYTYVPVNKVFTDILSDKPNEDFSTTANTYTLSGKIRTSNNSNVPNVVLRLATTAGPTSFSSSTVSNGTGDYSFVVPAGNTYSITPQTIPDMGYTFHSTLDESTLRTVGPVTVNVANLDFRADTNSYTVSGVVTGTGSDSTIVSVSGGSYTNTQKVASGGLYTFTLKGLIDYTITPLSNVYNFSPVNRVLTQLIGNKTNQNFAASPTLKTWKISGKVTKPGSTTDGLQNAVITFVTGSTVAGIVATNSNGYYEYSLNANSDYIVTPSLSGYNFAFDKTLISPLSTTSDSLVAKLQGDSTVNFTSTYKTATISGKVLHLGAPLPNVVFTLYKKIAGSPSWGASYGTTTSNGSGVYSFANLDQRYDYRIVPALAGYTFVPTEKVFLDLIGDKPNEDFSTSANTYSLSGKVATSNNSGVANVIMKIETVSGPISFTTSTQTNTSGLYSVSVPAGNTYRITPLVIPDNGFSYVNTAPGGGVYREVGPVSTDYINLDFRADTNIYSVTGIVTGTGTTTTRVTVTAPGFSTYQDISTDGGSFNFNLKGLIDYTITPSNTVYNFTPSLRLLTNLIGDKTNQDFAATANVKTYTISGKITRQDPGHVNEGVGNIIVKLSDGTDFTTTTNSTGYYEFTVPAGSTYLITPLVPPDVADHGYTFSPVNYSISTPVNQNYPNKDFTANLNKYSISGTVWNNGSKMNGVIIRLNDGTTNTDYSSGTVNAGEYSFINLDAHKNYTVTPLTSTGGGVGYTFVPITKTFNDMVGNKPNEDFATNSNTYKISGYVARDTTNLTTGVNNVVIALATLSGAVNFSSTTTTVTDPADNAKKGYYEFIVPAGNTYSITPLAAPDQGYSFSPAARNTSSPLSGSLSRQSFMANLNSYTISGKVWNNGTAMSGVTLELKKNNVQVATMVTLADGLYSFSALDAHSDYIVTPSKTGFSFIPQTRTFLDLVGDKPGEDFVTGENTHKISGYVRRVGGAPVPNITLNLVTVVGTPTINISAVSQANGYYEFSVPSGSTYKITPLIVPDQGYNFTPTDITTSVITTDLTNQNFTANLNNYTISGYVKTSAGGAGIQGVTVHCTGKSDVLTDPNGFYTFTVQALGTYTVSPEYTGLIFSPTFATFANLIGNKSQDFITITDRGQISADPTFLAFGDVLVNRKVTKTVVIANNGVQQIIVSNLLISGDAGSFAIGSTHTFPMILPPGGTQTIAIDFTPNSLGPKNGNLNIYHDAATANPLQVPLSGNGVATFVNLQVPTLINFGTVILGSGTKEQTIIIGNSSPFVGDYLNLNLNYFEATTGLFTVPTPFPIILGPGSTYPVVVRLNPNELGFKQNFLHILNSSANMPDARIEVRANIIQGELLVVPPSVDFGRTSQGVPYKDTLVRIQNNSAGAITILQKKITGDTASFTINNSTPIVLQPNQTDMVTVRFYPPTAGRKDGVFNISSNYSLAPELYVPLTGIGGDQPVIMSDMLTIDFGNLRNGEHKDTTVVIANQGSLDLVITSKTFIGLNPEIFSFVTDGNPVILRGGQTESIILRATGKLPIGGKSSQLVFANNDPTNPNFAIKLLANVRSNVLFKSVDEIVFDTVTVGYYQDSTFILRNDGDLTADISQMFLDGAYSSDFSLQGLQVPFQLQPGESKTIDVRFLPTATGLRYARIVIDVNDPQTPRQFIILKGWGKESGPIIDIGGGGAPENEYEIDFGRVPIFETKKKEMSIINRSKWETLRIDSMSIDPITKQPFSYGSLNFPFFVRAGQFGNVMLSFNPHDKINSYTGYLNIYYSDSVGKPNKNSFVRVRMKGTVSFPTANVDLTPVLKFGKVKKDESKTVQFKVTNLGETYLQMDSMALIGEDKGEFAINTQFPIKLEYLESALIPVTFNAKKVGSKDAQIVIYWNDLFVSGNVEIWAECVLTNNQTVGVKSLEIPVSFDIKQNYPNPFNPSTRIEYSIPQSSFVSIKIYNSIGQEVMDLVNETHSPGVYYVDFDAKHLPSGVYFYRISAAKFTSFKKMLLIK